MKSVCEKTAVLQERNAGNTPKASYTCCSDLSGTLEGAGGIGGLLARSDGYSSGSFTNHDYYQGDGNGNITRMIDANQTVVATYKYDPFGNTLSQSGDLADANVYQFSSKERMQIYPTQVGTLYYYGYRFYSPYWQRWLNRDPLGDLGFQLLTQQLFRFQDSNLYRFVRNNPETRFDPYGLTDWPWPANGSVCNNCKDKSVQVLINHKYYTLPPGKCTSDGPGSSDDVDGVWVDGKFYDVPGGHQGVKTCPPPKKTCTPKSRGAPNNSPPNNAPPYKPLPPGLPILIA